MLPLLLMLSFINCTQPGLYNISGMSTLLQNESAGYSACIPQAPSDLMGWAILMIVLVTTFGVMALRFDVAVAGAVAAWIATGVSLLLIQMVILPSAALGIPIALAVITTGVALVRGALKTYN